MPVAFSGDLMSALAIRTAGWLCRRFVLNNLTSMTGESERSSKR